MSSGSDPSLPRSGSAHRIGRYVLFDKIASGGMATVHVGRLDGSRGFRRTVAIKRLHRQYGENPEFVAMLLDEARITACIQHPNVVPVLDIVAADQELLLVMEYVHGESLSQLLRLAGARGERPSVSIIAQITSSVLSGLHAAHTCTGDDGVPLKVVHRDVSPQNVIVGHDGVARLIDFGIARAEQRTRGITRDGSVRGKISYMAPEQLGEDVNSIDHRADVYSAAQMFWEAVTGKLLFDDTLPVIVAKKVSATIPLASTIVPDLPPGLDLIIAKGLARRPADRWKTAEDMARAIEETVPPITAREIGAWVNKLASDRLEKRAALVKMAQEDRFSLEATSLPDAVVSGPALPPSTNAAAASSGDVTSADPITFTNPQDALAGLDARSGSGSGSESASGSSSVSPRPVLRPASSSASTTSVKRPIIIGAALGLGVMGVFLIGTTVMNMRAKPTTQPPPSAALTTTATATAPTLVNPPASTTPPPEPTPSATASTSATASASASVKPPAPTARPIPAKGPCDPPWRVDERGVRVLKRECFK